MYFNSSSLIITILLLFFPFSKQFFLIFYFLYSITCFITIVSVLISFISLFIITIMKNLPFKPRLQTNKGESLKFSRKKVTIQTESEENKIDVQKISSQVFFPRRKSQGFKTRRMIQTQQKFMGLIEIREVLMKEYKSLLKFYETNEDKLHRIIWKQLYGNNRYLYSKQIMSFIKYPDFQLLKTLNLDLFKNDVIKISQFLAGFNTNKKIKQVQIIKQSMINRESLIRQTGDFDDYERIFKTMRTPNKTSYTIYDQYKNIRASFNLETNKQNIHERLYKKIYEAENYVNNVMREKLITMERQNVRILGGRKRKKNTVEN